MFMFVTACGCRVNMKDSSHDSALHKSVSKGLMENVECLLEGGADPDIQNGKKQTILHILAKGMGVIKQTNNINNQTTLNKQQTTKSGYSGSAIYKTKRNDGFGSF